MAARGGGGQNAVTAETIIWSLSRFVIASEAKQSMVQREERMDCVVASLLAMTNPYGNASGLEQPR
ncbi:uncharacterized protein YggE [Bradyrhizobium sp. AZCC 2289]